MTKTIKPEMPFDEELDESLLNGSVSTEDLQEELEIEEEEELL
jgi:hypothetical protein